MPRLMPCADVRRQWTGPGMNGTAGALIVRCWQAGEARTCRPAGRRRQGGRLTRLRGGFMGMGRSTITASKRRGSSLWRKSRTRRPGRDTITAAAARARYTSDAGGGDGNALPRSSQMAYGTLWLKMKWESHCSRGMCDRDCDLIRTDRRWPVRRVMRRVCCQLWSTTPHLPSTMIPRIQHLTALLQLQ